MSQINQRNQPQSTWLTSLDADKEVDKSRTRQFYASPQKHGMMMMM